jgi:predicted SAM-dependent methyltransferase
LNLGCGKKTIVGYENVDNFKAEYIDAVYNLYEIPYKDNTISEIHSEHALEHVGYEKGKQAIKDWFRVLKPGGVLDLKIPDLELCIKNFFESTNDNYKEWYKYTIFGYQKALAGESDDSQIHRWGYTKDEIQKLLEGTGFVIDYLLNYDGHDTPSIGIRAIKPVSNIKIGWISPIYWDAAQTRIRVLNIDRWLRSRGYKSKIVNYPEIISQNYDIAIVGKTFDENHFKNIRLLKQHNKTVFCDLCEDILDNYWVNEIIKICDKVICCSYKLAEKVAVRNPNVEVIEDAYEA